MVRNEAGPAILAVEACRVSLVVVLVGPDLIQALHDRKVVREPHRIEQLVLRRGRRSFVLVDIPKRGRAVMAATFQSPDCLITGQPDLHRATPALNGRHHQRLTNTLRGDSVYLFDETGRQYIGMDNNVPCVGHGNPVVAEAVARQMSTLQVHSRYLHEAILDYAERLLALHHSGMQSVVFACSGTEASEIALLMARATTGGQGIICSDATYHGNSTEVSKMSRVRLSSEQGSSEPVDPHFRAVPFPQKYRPLDGDANNETLCNRYLQKVKEAIDDFKAREVPFAGMMGKPMGNGRPISAVVSSRENVAAFRQQTRYFNTFASSPLQAAAGMAVLNEIEGRGLREASAATGRVY